MLQTMPYSVVPYRPNSGSVGRKGSRAKGPYRMATIKRYQSFQPVCAVWLADFTSTAVQLYCFMPTYVQFYESCIETVIILKSSMILA